MVFFGIRRKGQTAAASSSNMPRISATALALARYFLSLKPFRDVIFPIRNLLEHPRHNLAMAVFTFFTSTVINLMPHMQPPASSNNLLGDFLRCLLFLLATAWVLLYFIRPAAAADILYAFQNHFAVRQPPFAAADDPAHVYHDLVDY